MCIFGKKNLLMNLMTIIIRVGDHKPLFEDSPSECGGGAATEICANLYVILTKQNTYTRSCNTLLLVRT